MERIEYLMVSYVYDTVCICYAHDLYTFQLLNTNIVQGNKIEIKIENSYKLFAMMNMEERQTQI